MLNNDEIQRIIADIESGAYDVADVLEAIASAAKGEDVRAALYASVYATKTAQIGGQPKIVTNAADMKNPDIKYLYMGNEEGYDYGYVYAFIDGSLMKTNLYGEGKAGYSPHVTVTQTETGVQVTITDQSGTTTATVLNGVDGEDGTATDAQVEEFVAAWLDEHPEATTTVEDESITEEKLSPEVAAKLNGVGLSADVKSALLACFRNVAWVGGDGKDYYDALEEALYPPANLVSISAVFNSGAATIYNTDDLDDLKQYLVVTALYDDGSTGIVTNYTLTGTIATGTQTITVTYGGMTTTFTVTVAEWLVSISAAYVQSGTVSDTDTLESLKADLTVTANYADSTSDVLLSSQYELSGTLAGGTSTITASYGGKTDTFTVVVTSLQYAYEVVGTGLVNTSGDVTPNNNYNLSDFFELDSNYTALTFTHDALTSGTVYAYIQFYNGDTFVQRIGAGQTTATTRRCDYSSIGTVTKARISYSPKTLENVRIMKGLV